MSTFTAFFDESEAGAVFFIGGWVATAVEWAKFSAAWDAALIARPPIGYLSHHDWKALKGEFEGWSKSDADSKIDDLVKVIGDHEMYGILGGLNTDTWKEAFQTEVLSQKQLKSILGFTHPYQSCFHGAVSMVLQIQLKKGHVAETVDFVFDNQTGLLKDSIGAYQQFKSGFPADRKAIAGAISVGDDKHLPPLQAADLLCGQSHTNLITGKPERVYETLVTCHEVVQFPSYPPNFQLIPGVVEALGIVWTAKQELDEQEKHPSKDNDGRPEQPC
jgi:hypothetical protein